MNDQFKAGLASVFISLSLVAMSALFLVQYMAFRRTAQRSLRILFISTASAIAGALLCNLPPVFTANQTFLTVTFILGWFCILLQVSGGLWGATALLHSYLEMTELAKSGEAKVPRLGFVEAYGIRFDKLVQVLNWVMIGVAVLSVAFAQIFGKLFQVLLPGLLIIPSGLALRALTARPGVPSALIGLLVNGPFALLGYAGLVFTLFGAPPQPLLTALLSVFVCAVPYSINVVFFLGVMRRAARSASVG
ncbi:MAG: hypothetical protein P4L83_25870 [Nevskia sp.]|nr:hypothetical protein [Nevskia sp.]